jgi:outer membrane receptor for ferrienterochelin and colicins
MRPAPALASALFAWLCVAPAFVRAQRAEPSSSEARSAVQARFFDDAARAAYARGDYEAALADFFEVSRVAPSLGTLYNVAVCADLTHRDALAFEALERYLVDPTDDASRVADARRRLAALEGRVARVRVTSSEPGATIWVDRRDLGAFGVTPRTLVLSAGAHVITLTHPRAHDAQTEVVAEVGALRESHVALVARTGRLRVTLEGSTDASVRAAREDAPEGEADRAIDVGQATELPIGTYVVTARREGFLDVSARVQVREGEEASRTLTLAPRPRVVGVLVVRSDVVSTVRVDGVDRAQTPARIPALDVGVHRVEIVAPGRVPWTGDVEITRERARFVSVSLAPER